MLISYSLPEAETTRISRIIIHYSAAITDHACTAALQYARKACYGISCTQLRVFHFCNKRRIHMKSNRK